MSQPLRCLVTGSAGAGVSLASAATFVGGRGCATGGATVGGAGGGTAAATGCVAGAVSLGIVDTEGFGEDGQAAAAGGGAGATSGLAAVAATGAAAAGANGGSLLTVEIVVTLAGLDTTGAGTSWRLLDGSGVSEAVYIVAGWTITVLTEVGFIGSVDPGPGPSGTDGATEAMRTRADPVRSASLMSLLSLRSCAVSTPSPTGGAVRLFEAMLMLFLVRLRTRASRASAGGPPNTDATGWRLVRPLNLPMLNSESRTLHGLIQWPLVPAP